MIRVLRSSLLASVLAAVACIGVHAADEPKSHADLIDKAAPDIAAGELNFNGKAAKLSDYKGKVVLIDFWAVWCGPCIATMPTLREWHDEYKDKGLVILGVTRYEGRWGGFNKETGRPVPEQGASKEKEEEMLKGFVEYHKLNYPISVQTKANNVAASSAYLVKGIPTAILVDRKGVVRMIKVGSGDANKKALKAEIEKLLGES